MALALVPKLGEHRGNRPVEPHAQGVGPAADLRGDLLPGAALCFQVEKQTGRFTEPATDRRGEVLVLGAFADMRRGTRGFPFLGKTTRMTAFFAQSRLDLVAHGRSEVGA